MKKEGRVNVSGESVKKKRFSQGLPVFHPYAGGIDIGDTAFDVAVSDGVSGFEVRKYPTFTEDTINCVDWLSSIGITTVAMEATGI